MSNPPKPNAAAAGTSAPSTIPDFELTTDQGSGYSEFIKKYALRNPFVPLGLIATGGALAFGLRAMSRGDRHQSQVMMRYRVGFQFFTIFALVAGFIVSGEAFKKESDDDN